VVEVRIVDQALPAHRGAGLFEVHPHHDLELAGEALALLLQALRVLAGRRRVVDRARPHDDEQAVVHAVDDAVDRLARLVDQPADLGTRLELADQVGGRRQFGDVADADVIRGAGSAGGWIDAFRGGVGGGGKAHRASCGGCRWGPGRRGGKKNRRSAPAVVSDSGSCLLRTRSRLVPPGAGKAKEPKVGKVAANHGDPVYEDSPDRASKASLASSRNSTRPPGLRPEPRPTAGASTVSREGSIPPWPDSQPWTACARSCARSTSWLSPTGTVASSAFA